MTGYIWLCETRKGRGFLYINDPDRDTLSSLLDTKAMSSVRCDRGFNYCSCWECDGFGWWEPK